LTPSTPFAYPQVASRTFASFRVVNSRVSAGNAAGSIPGSSTRKHRSGRMIPACSRLGQHTRNNAGYARGMASLRIRTRADAEMAIAVGSSDCALDWWAR
jgi:hypothetical protein